MLKLNGWLHSRTSKTIFGYLWLFAFALSFQNCGGMTTDGLQTSTSTSPTPSAQTALNPCIANGCPQDPSYIQIQVTNSDPITFLVGPLVTPSPVPTASPIPTPTPTPVPTTVVETAVDVSGLCNVAGFPGSHIYYTIQDGIGNIIVQQTLAPASCSALGRFQFSIYVGALSPVKNYTLSVELRALGSDGSEIDSPIGLNKAQVGIAPRTGY